MENQIIPTPAPSTNLVLISLDDLEVVINSFKSLIIEGDQCERRAWYYRAGGRGLRTRRRIHDPHPRGEKGRHTRGKRQINGRKFGTGVVFAYICRQKGNLNIMYWIAIVILFFFLTVRDRIREKRHPGYRSWMDDDDNAWDQWRRHHD